MNTGHAHGTRPTAEAHRAAWHHLSEPPRKMPQVRRIATCERDTHVLTAHAPPHVSAHVRLGMRGQTRKIEFSRGRCMAGLRCAGAPLHHAVRRHPRPAVLMQTEAGCLLEDFVDDFRNTETGLGLRRLPFGFTRRPLLAMR